MFLHADAVAQNRPAGVGAGRIDRNNSHRVIVLAIKTSKLIDQRALPRSRRPRQPQHARLPAVLKQSLQQLRPSRCAILYDRNGAGQRAHIAGAKLINPCLDGLVQAISVKQSVKKKKSAVESRARS
jgi:hypothetical protein